MDCRRSAITNVRAISAPDVRGRMSVHCDYGIAAHQGGAGCGSVGAEYGVGRGKSLVAKADRRAVSSDWRGAVVGSIGQQPIIYTALRPIQPYVHTRAPGAIGAAASDAKGCWRRVGGDTRVTVH